MLPVSAAGIAIGGAALVYWKYYSNTTPTPVLFNVDLSKIPEEYKTNSIPTVMYDCFKVLEEHGKQ